MARNESSQKIESGKNEDVLTALMIILKKGAPVITFVITAVIGFAGAWFFSFKGFEQAAHERINKFHAKIDSLDQALNKHFENTKAKVNSNLVDIEDTREEIKRIGKTLADSLTKIGFKMTRLDQMQQYFFESVADLNIRAESNITDSKNKLEELKGMVTIQKEIEKFKKDVLSRLDKQEQVFLKNYGQAIETLKNTHTYYIREKIPTTLEDINLDIYAHDIDESENNIDTLRVTRNGLIIKNLLNVTTEKMLHFNDKEFTYILSCKFLFHKQNIAVLRISRIEK